MRILVTGATSQTGSLAARALVREGHNVRCLVRTEGNRRFLPAHGIEIVRGDLEQPAALPAAFDNIEAVAHIAHIRFAPTVIAECERAGIRRAIFFSSTRLFTKFDCRTKRQVAKAEKGIEASGLDYTILRPSMIYGSARDKNVSRLVAYLRRHRFFPLVGGGRNLVQPVFTLDVVDALVESLRRPEAIGKAYTLAGPEAITYREMIAMIARELQRRVSFVPIPLGPALAVARCYEALSRRPRVTREQIQRFAEDRAFDVAPARRDLDFGPVSFEEGVGRQIAGQIDAM